MARAKKLDKSEQTRQLLEQAKTCDKAALLSAVELKDISKELMPVVREIAAMPEIYDALGSIAAQSEASLIQLISNGSVFTKEATKSKLSEITKSLAGDSPSPLEELLVNRVLLCWLQLHYVETLFTQRAESGLSMDRIRGYQNWLDRAHNRYLSAIKALAHIRKMDIPAIQVNIGDKQINTIGNLSTDLQKLKE